MTYVAQAGELDPIRHPGADSLPLHTEEKTPVKGCYTMLNRFYESEYPKNFGVHEDNEGFYVVSGKGYYWLEGREWEIGPGSAMLAPAGQRHGLKKSGDADLTVFIYHFPSAKGDHQ